MRFITSKLKLVTQISHLLQIPENRSVVVLISSLDLVSTKRILKSLNFSMLKKHNQIISLGQMLRPATQFRSAHQKLFMPISHYWFEQDTSSL